MLNDKIDICFFKKKKHRVIERVKKIKENIFLLFTE